MILQIKAHWVLHRIDQCHFAEPNALRLAPYQFNDAGPMALTLPPYHCDFVEPNALGLTAYQFDFANPNTHLTGTVSI